MVFSNFKNSFKQDDDGQSLKGVSVGSNSFNPVQVNSYKQYTRKGIDTVG
jgi:hypothetical protein